MLQDLYLFNPDNDLALANGDGNYMSSAKARQMADDLALLPAWYAEKGSFVLVSLSIMEYAKKQVFPVFLTRINLINEEELQKKQWGNIIPWGWNLVLCKQLLIQGVQDSVLPSLEQMHQMREYSHRSYAVSLLSLLPFSEKLCSSPTCLYTVQEVEEFVQRYPKSIFKAPWSGSGRGLFWCEGEYSYPLKQWCVRTIKKQRCVIGEAIYNKVEDFAMEFYSDGSGRVTFAGFSLFYTNKHGAYKKNLLASDQYIFTYLSGYVGEELIWEIRNELERHLSPTIGKVYKGYLGVDMMICCFQDKPFYRMHPCVEINLRMSMGMVARLVADRYLCSGAKGYFSVNYFADSSLLVEDHRSQTEAYPLVVENGRVRSGYLSLTPVGERTNYQARVWVE